VVWPAGSEDSAGAVDRAPPPWIPVEIVADETSERRKGARIKVISYKEFTTSTGLIRISHLGKSGFLSSFFSIARIAFLVSEIPF
jgi:hypothetical protein